MKRVVISATSSTEGGPLTVLDEMLRAAERIFDASWEIIVLVHNKGLITSQRAKIIEIPLVRKSWFVRLYYEWFGYYKISKKFPPDLWVALNDMTPRVSSARQVVYCHNATPFYSVALEEAKLEPKLLLFSFVYKYAYAHRIHNNYAVVVQQNWLRKAFFDIFHHRNIVVAHPVASEGKLGGGEIGKENLTIFLYPTFPRVFKNIEIICEAIKLIPSEMRKRIQVRITIDGTENRYSRSLIERYGRLECVKFIGRLDLSEVTEQYHKCQCVLFPSKLETWGLPISEGKLFGKRLLVADLPYAYEAVGTYKDVEFLPISDATAWAGAMGAILQNSWYPPGNIQIDPPAPYAPNWDRLWEILICDL